MESIFRTVGAGKTFLSPTDYYIKVDTSGGAVEIVLPNSALVLTSQNPTTISQYSGIRFVDISNNASSNNITIIAFDDDKVNSAP